MLFQQEGSSYAYLHLVDCYLLLAWHWQVPLSPLPALSKKLQSSRVMAPGPYGGYGPIGPATSPAVVVPYLAPNGTTVYPIMMSKSSVKPGPNSTVKVNYRGWLADGTEFDSSYSRGQPAVFELNKTISCWQQGLQTVPVGSKVKLVCPPATAYGANQVGNIPPNSTLTYEVELLEVMN